MKPRKKN
jgi:hypothetical protein